MRKIIIFIFLGLIFLSISAVGYAQSEETDGSAESETQQQSEKPAIILDIQYDAVLEYFLTKITQGNFLRIYEMMTDNFKQINSLDNLKKVLDITGLISFSSYKWTNFDDSNQDAIQITGVFETSSGPHAISFVLKKHILKGWQIDGIIENVTLADLSKQIPESENLKEMVKNDLKKLTFFIKKRRSKAIYNYLSNATRGLIRLIDIQKAIMAFKKSKLKITFPKNEIPVIKENYPQLNDQGQMIIQGTYKNNKNLVTFTLTYSYEWEWKLSIFSLDAKPLAATEAQ